VTQLQEELNFNVWLEDTSAEKEDDVWRASGNIKGRMKNENEVKRTRPVIAQRIAERAELSNSAPQLSDHNGSDCTR
jgi:hypothetical protein